MLDPSLKNQFQGTIRSKKFNQNFFVGRGNFFNDEATILNESNNNTVASIKLKEEKFIPNLNSSPFFYIDHYIKNPRISIQKYNKSKILNNSLKMTKFKAETSNYKQNSIENEFDYLLQVHILKIYLYFYYKSSIPLFQKSPYLRTENDIVTLISLARQIKFFKEQPTEKMETIVNECAKCMQYQFGKRNEIIFKEGSIGNSFYIILKGTVGIYKNQNTESKSPKNSNNKQIMRDSKSKSHLLFNMSSLNLGSFEDIENNKILITNNLNPLKHKVNPLDSVENLSIITPAKEKTMNEIIEFHTGASFGEYALLEDQPRSATVICKEDTHFAVLDQKSFKKVLGIE